MHSMAPGKPQVVSAAQQTHCEHVSLNTRCIWAVAQAGAVAYVPTRAQRLPGYHRPSAREACRG
jgi:hypothetical protein